MTVKILRGDCRKLIKKLEDRSIDCVITSPPYWGLRNYENANQLGMESSPEEYVENLRGIFSEIRRALKDHGTVWLNLGDCYAGGSYTGRNDVNVKTPGRSTLSASVPKGKWRGLPPKNLIGIPWRVAFALQQDGWVLRSDIIWSKPNPTPESVPDRPTRAHEYIFLFSKSPRYFYDADAIREPYQSKSYKFANPKGKNRRTVWTITPKPCKEAHFATYPPELIEPCIKAGCPEGGTILDPFFGAGTTGLVAKRLNRHCIGMELNPDYAVIAAQRLKADQPKLK
ncbi:MAG: DNA-methyltransferase [Alphaproteobacteria bacterium]